MKALTYVLFVVASILSSSAFARTPVPLADYSSVPVAAASGKTLSADQVKQAVRKAAVAKNWTVANQPDGKMVLSLAWNNKHTIVVDVACSPEVYSLVYRDSINMKYGVVDGQATIHPYYNRFVRDLSEAIRLELTRL